MPDYLRLKQICLVAPSIEPTAATDIGSVMGLDICYRDPRVGAYGLENVLYPVDDILLEVVAPTEANTAAGRYLDRLERADVKEGYHGGYMVIFTASDVERRREHAKAIGIRIAHIIDRPTFYGIQLHRPIAAHRSSISIAPRTRTARSATAFSAPIRPPARAGKNTSVRIGRRP